MVPVAPPGGGGMCQFSFFAVLDNVSLTIYIVVTVLRFMGSRSISQLFLGHYGQNDLFESGHCC